jgi:hypothetical protein
MHDFILKTGGDHAGRGRFGAVLETHHHLDFGTEGFAIEFDGLFATAVEEEIGLDEAIIVCRTHIFNQCFVFVFIITTNVARRSGHFL